MYAVDKYGKLLYVDLWNSDNSLTFPLTAIYPEGYTVDLVLTYSVNNCSDMYSKGYDEGYSAGYDEGDTTGFDTGYEWGYNEGYTLGTVHGYNNGYTDGYDEGYTNGENLTQSQVITNPITAFLQPVHEFMNTKFFGNLSYASLFNVVLFVVVALIFLKMFSGG